MEFQIREMKEADWEQVGKIYKQGMDSNLATFQTELPTYEEWDKGHLNICRLVAVKNDKIIGWAALLPTSSRKAYEGVVELSLYIDENHRRCGVGSELMKHMFHETEQHGIWTIQSLIMQNNEPSIKLHIKNGFREVGYRYKIAKDRYGNWRNTVIYERRSDNPIFN